MSSWCKRTLAGPRDKFLPAAREKILVSAQARNSCRWFARISSAPRDYLNGVERRILVDTARDNSRAKLYNDSHGHKQLTTLSCASEQQPARAICRACAQRVTLNHAAYNSAAQLLSTRRLAMAPPAAEAGAGRSVFSEPPEWVLLRGGLKIL